MVRQSVQLSARARGRCPSFGLLCFLCAFVAAVFGAQDASADAPLPAIKTTQLAVPAVVLGVTNPHLLAAVLNKPDIVAAGLERPKVRRFTLSKHLQKLYRRMEILAIYGVTLNQRRVAHEEKLNLRVQGRLGGGVLQLRYRR